MSHERWRAIDRYLAESNLPADPVLEAVVQRSAEAGLPSIQVSPLQGALLNLLARTRDARRILEVGTLGGYSTICLARALPVDGSLISLEAERAHADVARENIAQAGLADRVEVRVGAALDSLQALVDEDGAPFDCFFIDADKANIPSYVTFALRLARPGSLLIVDNVIRAGRVLDAESDAADIRGIRRFHRMLGEERRLDATSLQWVGDKGHDGFSIALVNDHAP